MAKAQQRGPGPTGADPRSRLGPRPLALHLALAVLTWTSSRAALRLSRSGSLPWNPALGEAAAGLEGALAEVAPEALEAAVDREARHRLEALLAGIEAYRRHPYRRGLADPPAVWREGTTGLLDYGTVAPDARRAGAPPVLVVPSLINRAYVLDLSETNSLLRWLAAQGFRPFLVDWGRPGPEERRFTLTDYIAGRLEAALDSVIAETGRRPLLAGYCMGGLLALGLALRREGDLAGLALLATPWDFHVEHAALARLAAAGLVPFSPVLETLGEMPVDLVQGLFASLDPQLVLRKFAAFARLDPTSARARAFVALEDWLNDGVPLAAPVARECLLGWYGDNTTATGAWRVAGRAVDPHRLALPTLCLVPARDRIVPPASAAALAAAIPGAHQLTPPAGHIGMVVSAGARRQVWEPLSAWLRERAATAR